MHARSRGPALAVLCAATLMIILDGTIVTVALPSVQRSLGFSPTALTWVVNAYMIAFGSLLLLAGRLGDLIGRKQVLLAGLALFTAASLLCAASTSPAMLIASRFVQGAGGALVSAVALGMIVALYPEPREQARALSVFSFVGAAGAAIGLLAGGVLTQLLNWHWIFLVNLPIGLVTALLAVRVLDSGPGLGLRAGADALGALLVTAGLMLGIYAVVADAWAGIPAAVLLAAFVVRQAKASVPLLRLRIFASRNISGVFVVQLLVIAAAWGFQVLITMYMQRVLGYGAATTGLAFAPTAVVIGAVSLGFAARLIQRLGARVVLLAGLVLIGAALALLTTTPTHAAYPSGLLPGLLIFGLGGGLTLPALATLGMSAATPQDAGLISGLFNTGQQLGGALGVAALSALAAARTRGLAASGHDAASTLTGGYHLAFAIGAGLAVASIALAALILRRPAPPAPSPTDPLAGSSAEHSTEIPPAPAFAG
ncbi:MAG TPA: MFS transporter [Actinocrinis sp.]|nr:MFS transporter [Actinocrinis sp.]